jgi:putative peptide zinc metalloprotease protein
LPYEIDLTGNAIREVGSGSTAELLDGIIVLIVLGVTQSLWVISWWRRHGTRLIGRWTQIKS